MDFSLSEEQQLLQDTVRSLLENECPPARVREIFDSDAGTAPELWTRLCELGVAGLCVPETEGGSGLGILEAALVSETIGEAAAPLPFFGHTLACRAIATAGSDAQRERWLPALASGERLASVALGESDGRFLPEQWTLRCDGDTVSGKKDFVPAGLEADLVVVGCAGGELAIVETGASGVSRQSTEALDRGRRMAAFEFDVAPAERLAGGAEALRDAALVLLAAEAFGAGFRLVRMSADYARTREQFGQPIAAFQGIKHQLANMAVQIDPTRGLWWWAAYAQDELPDEAERAAALAKALVTDRAVQVARDAVEIHGGLGFTWECDVQIWFKRALFTRQFLGSPQIHRERIATISAY